MMTFDDWLIGSIILFVICVIAAWWITPKHRGQEPPFRQVDPVLLETEELNGYTLVEEYNPLSLADEVELQISQGWRPHGGISVVRHNKNDELVNAEPRYLYTQAMVR